MVDDGGKEGRLNWRDPKGYASMLKLDRRAWAAQCVSRDPTLRWLLPQWCPHH